MKPMLSHIASRNGVDALRNQEFMPLAIAASGPIVKGLCARCLPFNAGFAVNPGCENPALRVGKTRLAKRLGLEAKWLRG